MADKIFPNSKITDADGNLQVMYHGTRNGKFDTFDNSKGVSASAIEYKNLYAFTSSVNTANSYRIGRQKGEPTGEKIGASTQSIKHVESIDTSRIKKKDLKKSAKELREIYPKSEYGFADPFGQWHYFSTEEEAKNELAKYSEMEYGSEQVLIRAYLDVQNPFVFDAYGRFYRDALDAIARMNPDIAWTNRDSLGNWIGGLHEDLGGHDGIIIKNVDDNGCRYSMEVSDVVFVKDNSQIKIL